MALGTSKKAFPYRQMILSLMAGRAILLSALTLYWRWSFVSYINPPPTVYGYSATSPVVLINPYNNLFNLTSNLCLSYPFVYGYSVAQMLLWYAHQTPNPLTLSTLQETQDQYSRILCWDFFVLYGPSFPQITTMVITMDQLAYAILVFHDRSIAVNVNLNPKWLPSLKPPPLPKLPPSIHQPTPTFSPSPCQRNNLAAPRCLMNCLWHLSIITTHPSHYLSEHRHG
jgi:hypothetical protein